MAKKKNEQDIVLRNRFINLDKLYIEQTELNATYLVTPDSFQDGDVEHKRAIIAYFTATDMQEFVTLAPSCRCGETVGEFEVGVICPNPTCGSECKPFSFTGDNLWLKTPTADNNKNSLKWISPPVIMQLLNINKVLFTGFLQGRMPKPEKIVSLTLQNRVARRVIENLMKDRTSIKTLNYEYLYNNLEDILKMIIETPPVSTSISKEATEARSTAFNLIQHIRNKPEVVFHTMLPLPTNRLTITEKVQTKSAKMVKVLETGAIISNVVKTYVNEFDSLYPNIPKMMGNVMYNMSLLLDNLEAKVFNKKSSIPRKSIFSGNLPLTGRYLVISYIGDHNDMNGIYLPWSGSCATYRHIIMHHLVFKLKMNYQDAEIKYLNAIHKYDTDVNDAFDHLETLKPSVTIHRNPTQHHGGYTNLANVHIKRDVSDKSVSTSILEYGPSNKDNDGDMITVIIHMSKQSSKDFERFGIRSSVAYGKTPDTTYGKIGVLKTSANISGKVYNERKSLGIQDAPIP